MVEKEQVMEALKGCVDPEIGMNLVELGLIYDVIIDKDKVTVRMTLTTPGCPMANMILGEVEEKVKNIKGVGAVEVEIVWDPPWNPERMTEEAKAKLGFA